MVRSIWGLVSTTKRYVSAMIGISWNGRHTMDNHCYVIELPAKEINFEGWIPNFPIKGLLTGFPPHFCRSPLSSSVMVRVVLNCDTNTRSIEVGLVVYASVYALCSVLYLSVELVQTLKVPNLTHITIRSTIITQS